MVTARGRGSGGKNAHKPLDNAPEVFDTSTVGQLKCVPFVAMDSHSLGQFLAAVVEIQKDRPQALELEVQRRLGVRDRMLTAPRGCGRVVFNSFFPSNMVSSPLSLLLPILT